MILDRTAVAAWDAIWNYGSTPTERLQAFPCDQYIAKADTVVYRAITVEVPAETMFAWLCQLRAAPYSYDWIDNLGRPSPKSKDPALESLEVGHSVMRIFRLIDFELNRHLTLWHRGHVFGEIAGTYRVMPVGPHRCRLVVKLLVRYPRRSPISVFLRALLPLGDLVMMRRQLLNLAQLAARESTATVDCGP